MAVTIDPSSAPAPAPSASVLASLRAYVRLVETRRSVQAEMDQALGSFLTATPAALARGGADPLSAGAAAEEAESVSGRGGAGTGTGTGTGVGSERGSDAGAPLSTCAAEAIRPPNEAELQQVLQIAFGGLVEVKEHARIIVAELEDRWDRADLARMVRAVEEDESKRIKLTLERDQLRRLQTLQPELEFGSTIQEKDAARTALAREIQEQMQDVHAEIADLAATETEGEEGL